MRKRVQSVLRIALTLVAIVAIAACTNPQASPNRPDRFTFEPAVGVEPGAVVTSNVETITGSTAPLEAKVAGGDAVLLINGDAAAAEATVSPGDEIAVRLTASSVHEETVTATVTVGSVSANFAVTTRALSATPNQFEFEPETGVELDAVVTSNTVTLAGFDDAVDADVTGGILLLNGEAVTETPVEVSSGDEVAVQVTASSVHEETVTATVTVGTISADFAVTTRSLSATPNQFEFDPVTGVELDDVVTSNTVTLAGFDDAAQADVTGGTLILNGDDVATTPVAVNAGDEIAVRVTASDSYSVTTSATVTIGSVSATFDVTTRAAPVAPTITDVSDDVGGQAAPGELVTLSWTIDGDYDELLLSVDGGAAVNITSEANYTVTAPSNQPIVEYTLTVNNTEISETDTFTHTVDVPLWVCIDNTYPVTFADSELEGIMRANVPGIPSVGDITCTAVQAITSFESGHSDGNQGTIDSLVGLQHATGLTNLVMQFNEISDLTPIAGLTALEVINFDRNRVLDLSPLANLVNLVEIGFWDNGPTFEEPTDGITDISVLAGLPDLEVVYLSDNNISDISALSGLNNVRVLWLIRNDLTNASLTPLTGMTSLQSLRIGNQRQFRAITDATVFATLENLAWLDIQFTGFTDISFVGALDNLYALGLDGIRLANIDPLIASTFPDATVDHTLLGVGAPSAPRLTLASNCLETDPASATSVYIAGLIDGGTTVEGYTVGEQNSCGVTPDAQFDRDAYMLELKQGIGYR